MVKQKIIQNLQTVIQKMEVKSVDINLEPPTDFKFGDYTTNLALKLTKILKKNPLEIAAMIKDNYPQDKNIEKIEIAPPGFLNFYLTKNCLINEAILTKDWAKQIGVDKKKILVEFGQPNTHKIPHIGHLYSYVLGESLARILTAGGNKIIRLNYQGDIGLHVAKCLYAVKQSNKNFQELKTQQEKVFFLQQCYQTGSRLYDEDEKAKQAIREINKKIYLHDPEIEKLWQETRSWSLDFYQLFEKKLGIHYDRHYLESETSAEGLKIVKKNTPGVFEESQGAIIFKGEDYGLHTRVFINKQGNPTYEAKDIGLIALKTKELYPFDLSLVTTAVEQSEYWKVIIVASELLFANLKNKLQHIGFGMVNLTTGKMASRTGQIVDAFSLVEKVKAEIKKEFKTTDENAEKIAIASIKYSFLKNEVTKNMTFDLKSSIAKEGDSGPYLLYTYTRINSLLNKNTSSPATNHQSQIAETEELELLKRMGQFPGILENTLKILSPHLLINYLYKLAREYNNFYQKFPILKAEKNKELKLLITEITGQIIKDGLYLLGIETVEKM